MHNQSPQIQSTQPFIQLLSPLGLFPGRWVGGISLIVGPLLILTGALLRIEFYFFAPLSTEQPKLQLR